MARNNIYAIPMTSFAGASITANYLPIFTGGLPKACFVLRIINNANNDILISYDGVNDADYVIKTTSIIAPPLFNYQPNGYVAYFPKGMQVYLKGTAGSTGTVYVAGYYQPQGV